MTVLDGCYAQVIEDGARRSTGSGRGAGGALGIGSGDAFLAGYVAARYAGQPPVDCLRFGVACGAESTQHFGAGIIDPASRAARRQRSRQSASRSGAEIS